MSRQQRLVLIVAIMASFVAFLDGSVVNVALPAISRQLGGGLSLQQWVVDAYLITLGALMLVAGSFSDLFGRIKILRIGLLGLRGQLGGERKLRGLVVAGRGPCRGVERIGP